jgi:hypothetical protein
MKDKINYSPFSPGDVVKWKWAHGTVFGKIEEVYRGPVEREIKGKWIKRIGSVERPAYLVRSQAGNIALKLHTELAELSKEEF